MEEATTSETESLQETIGQIIAKPLTKQSFLDIAEAAFSMEHDIEHFEALLSSWDSVPVPSNVKDKDASRVVRAFGLLSAGRAQEAADSLADVKRHPWGGYYLARALLALRRPQEALKAAEEASSKNPDEAQLSFLLVELYAKLGRTEEASKVLHALKSSQQGTADLAYHEGLLLEQSGEYEDAIEKYRDAVRRDSRHAAALFRLAYVLELHGSEADETNEDALQAYERCVRIPPVHAQAVTNLGLMYEDRERYHDAIKCYETVLRAYPNDARAKLYLKDAHASTRMFYDREQEKKADKQSQVLRIPVSDFELSVRSRNCLQKMNIQTLGDLIMKTEQELLAYKNFGETSLSEIKEMLGQKGLRLGQGLDSRTGESPSGRNPLEATTPAEVLDRPIEDLNLSVRSRRCMERLEVRTVRDLINRTEVELMSAKNFGMTSLNEIKRKLTDMGLGLRP